MFDPNDILYEDNHVLVVNKRAGDLVQPDPSGTSALENEIKAFIKIRDSKPGDVFLGVVHRIDRPVSGAVIFAKTSKALARLNEMIKNRQISKIYWAITENIPEQSEGELVHHIVRHTKNNQSKALDRPTADSKEARLKFKVLGSSVKYHLIEVELLTGRHHQIRAQLSRIGCPIKGDLKYGAKRSNQDGGICLHSRSVSFIHPVQKEQITIVAPTPIADALWSYFEETNKTKI